MAKNYLVESPEGINEELGFPGDISQGASAGNVINCRCTEGYHVKEPNAINQIA